MCNCVSCVFESITASISTLLTLSSSFPPLTSSLHSGDPLQTHTVLNINWIVQIVLIPSDTFHCTSFCCTGPVTNKPVFAYFVVAFPHSFVPGLACLMYRCHFSAFKVVLLTSPKTLGSRACNCSLSVPESGRLVSSCVRATAKERRMNA